MDSENSKELLENLKAQSLHSVNSIKSFDFSTLYTAISHNKLKSKLKEIINQCFFHTYGNRRFQCVVIGYKDTYFVRDHSDAPQKKLRCRYHNEAGISNRQSVLWIFKQTIGIQMLTVHRCLPTCFYTRMKRSLYKVSSKQATPCTTIQFHLQIIRWCIVS